MKKLRKCVMCCSEGVSSGGKKAALREGFPALEGSIWERVNLESQAWSGRPCPAAGRQHHGPVRARSVKDICG